MLINDLFTMNQPVELPKYECNVSISTLLTLSHTMSVSHPCTNLMEAQKKSTEENQNKEVGNSFIITNQVVSRYFYKKW